MEDSASIQGGIALHNTVTQLDRAYACSVNLTPAPLHRVERGAALKLPWYYPNIRF
jgi:hypothetical protein